MTSAQFAKRLGMSPQGALDLERREASGSITLGKLRHAARALGSDLVIAFVPTTSLEEMVRHQAHAKAREERHRLIHTMRLEAQQEGVDEALDAERTVDTWLTQRVGRLWD